MDFGAITDGLTLDIEKTFYTDTPSFQNVQAIRGGQVEDDIIVGTNDGANELIAGAAATTIIGGANGDTLVGNNAGGTVFFHNNDQGKDTVTAYSSNDAVWTPYLSGVAVDGSDVKVFSVVTDADGNATRGENALTLKNGAVGDAFSIISGVGDDTYAMKLDLGKETTYQADTQFYGDIDKTGNAMTINAETGDEEQNEALYINAGDTGRFWNINKVDASNYAGELTVDGTLQDDTLIGGAGSNTLWGGVGSDLIQGGSGQNFVKYYMGFDGNDTITGLHDGDVLELNYLDIDGYRIAIKDESFTKCTDSSFALVMDNGDKLNVKGELADVTLRIRVGENYSDWKVNTSGSKGFHLADED